MYGPFSALASLDKENNNSSKGIKEYQQRHADAMLEWCGVLLD